jgi:hypothetical protein
MERQSTDNLGSKPVNVTREADHSLTHACMMQDAHTLLTTLKYGHIKSNSTGWCAVSS